MYKKDFLNENRCYDDIMRWGIRNYPYTNIDLNVLAKKYKNVDTIVDLCLKNFKGYDPDIHLDIIKRKVAWTLNPKNKYTDLHIESLVSITNKEVEKINSIDGEERKKIAFMLLLLAKIKGKQSDGCYYVYGNAYDYKKLAGIGKRDNKIFANTIINILDNEKYIEQGYTKKTRKNKRIAIKLKVLFVDESNDDIAFHLTEDDYLYPEHIYPKYFKEEKFILCEMCNVEISPNCNRQKRCENCRNKKKSDDTKEYVRIYREKCKQLEKAQKAI